MNLALLPSDRDSVGAPRALRACGRGLLAALLVALAGLLLAVPLSAEPYMAVREGYKCSKCHVNKTGGGMRTDYAQVYMNTRMAERAGEGGEANFVSGRINEHFHVGADLRSSANYDDLEGDIARWQFGRRTDCLGCHESGGKRGEIYARMEPAPGQASIVFAEKLFTKSSVASPEFYGLLEDLPLNGYVKAGNFRMPTGLQNTWDDPFIHGDAATVTTGNTDLVGLAPVRGRGWEAGIEPGPFSVSVSLTNPVNVSEQHAQKRKHLNASAVGGLGLLGLTYYVDPVSDALKREFTGVYAGVSLGRVTGLWELDNITATDRSSGAETDSQFSLMELNLLLTRGHNLKYVYEWYDPDVDAEQDVQDRSSFIYEPFVAPYFQWRLGYRYNNGPGQPAGPSAVNSQHYFLELHFMY